MKNNDEGNSTVTLIIRFEENGELHEGNHTIWEGGVIVSSETTMDNSTIFEFPELSGENQTVFSVLKQASIIANFSVEYSFPATQQDIFVDSIAKVDNGEGNWQYYLNGEYGIKASNNVQLKNDDLVEWKYE